MPCTGVAYVRHVQEWRTYAMYRSGVRTPCTGVVYVHYVQGWCIYIMNRSGVYIPCTGVVCMASCEGVRGVHTLRGIYCVCGSEGET